MLTDLQRKFLEKYIKSGSKLSADHAEASRLYDQLALEPEALPLLAELKGFATPEGALPGETDMLSDAIRVGIAALEGNLDDRAFATARDAAERSKALIKAIGARLETANAAIAEAFAKADSTIRSSGLPEGQLAAETIHLAELRQSVLPDRSNAETTMAEFAKLAEAVSARARQLADLRSRALEANKPVAGAAKTDSEQMAAACTAALSKIDAATTDEALSDATGAVVAVETLRATVTDAVALRAALALLTPPEGASDTEKSDLAAACKTCTDLLAGPLDADPLPAAQNAKTAAQGVLDKIAQRITTAKEAIAAGKQKVADALRDGGFAGTAATQFSAQADAIADKVSATFENSDAIVLELATLTTAIAELAGRLKPLVARADTAKIHPTGALKADITRLTAAFDLAGDTIRDAWDATTEAAAQKAVNDLETLNTLIGSAASARTKALPGVASDTIEAAVAALGDVATLDKIIKASGANAKLLLDAGKLKPAELAEAYKTVGNNAAALASALEIGFNRDPAKLKTLATAFPDTDTPGTGGAPAYNPRKNFGKLIEEGGFNDNPDALGHVLATGCAGDAAKLEGFAKAFSADSDKAALKGLLDKGGLGEAPRALGHLAALPDGPAKIKDLGTAFATPQDQKKLSDMILKGGMGGPTSRSPDALASLLDKGGASPAVLKSLHAGFGEDGMPQMSEVLASFQSKPPPPSDVGDQFKYVVTRVGNTASKVKTQYYDEISKTSASKTGDKVLGDIRKAPDVKAVTDALGENPGAAAKKGLAATWGATSTLKALEGVPGVDPGNVALLKQSTKALSDATVAKAGGDALMADPVKAGENALASVEAGLGTAADASTRDAAIKQANDTARSAGNAAEQAEAALKSATPPTKTLIEAAANAAKQAVSAAAKAPDDTLREAVLKQADKAFEAVRAVTSKLASDLASGARAAADTDTGTKSTAGGAAASTFVNTASPGNEAAWETALGNTLDCANRSAQTHIVEAIATDETLQALQAESARLKAIAERPEASRADLLAAAEADAAAQTALAAGLATVATAQANGLTKPDCTPPGIARGVAGTETSQDPAGILRAVIRLKAAVTAAVAELGALGESHDLQARIVMDAGELAGRDGATKEETDALVKEQAKLADIDAKIVAARTRASEIASSVSNAGLSLTSSLKFERRVNRDATQNRTAQITALEDASCAVVMMQTRIGIAGNPALSRADTLGIGATMKKAGGLHLMHEEDGCIANAKSDVKHFCGRHTREHFAFSGRDFAPEDETTLGAVMDARISGKTNADGRTPQEKAAAEKGRQMKTTSLWPAGFKEADIKACLALAVAALETRLSADPEPKNVDTTYTWANIRKYIDLPDTSRTHEGTQFSDLEITYNGLKIKTQLGVSADGVAPNYKIGQFFPSDTPSVPYYDMNAIKAGLGV